MKSLRRRMSGLFLIFAPMKTMIWFHDTGSYEDSVTVLCFLYLMFLLPAGIVLTFLPNGDGCGPGAGMQ